MEFKPEDQYNTVRDLTEIAKRYLKGRFLIDFLALIPLQYMFNTLHAHLFLLIKIVRLQQGSNLVNSNTFMRQIKMIFNKKLERLVDENPKLAKNSDLDNNNIMLILMISYFFKVVKLVIFIVIVSYFMGMLWYIYCELTQKPANDDEDLGFILFFKLDQKTNTEKAIIVTYWAFTTLSTVGFGDFFPRSNAERGLCAFILLFGVTIFSYIMGNYIMILNSI